MNIKPLIPTYVSIARKNQVDDRTVVKEYFNKDKVRELEQQRDELLKVFIDFYHEWERYGDHESYSEDMCIGTIEQISGKSWKEIKGLMNERL